MRKTFLITVAALAVASSANADLLAGIAVGTPPGWHFETEVHADGSASLQLVFHRLIDWPRSRPCRYSFHPLPYDPILLGTSDPFQIDGVGRVLFEDRVSAGGNFFQLPGNGRGSRLCFRSAHRVAE